MAESREQRDEAEGPGTEVPVTALVQVVVPCYGTVDRLALLLRRLDDEAREQKTRISVVVSDDGSPVHLDSLLDRKLLPHLEVRVVRGRNGGPGAARNRGLRACSSKWVAFLDADTLPRRGRFGVLLEVLSQCDGLADGIEGNTVIPDSAPSPFAHATAIDSRVAHGGANIIYNRDFLLQLGGFDERFYNSARRFHFREDNEMYFRALGAGGRVVQEPELVIEHPPLTASYLTPIRLARRYYLDPLLGKLHANEFRELNRTRMIGPVSLRLARHLAANALVVTVGVLAVGAQRRSSVLIVSASGACATAWVANFASLSWKRRLRPRDIAPVALLALPVPFTYTSNYYLGALRFRHVPKLQ